MEVDTATAEDEGMAGEEEAVLGTGGGAESV